MSEDTNKQSKNNDERELEVIEFKDVVVVNFAKETNKENKAANQGAIPKYLEHSFRRQEELSLKADEARELARKYDAAMRISDEKRVQDVRRYAREEAERVETARKLEELRRLEDERLQEIRRKEEEIRRKEEETKRIIEMKRLEMKRFVEFDRAIRAEQAEKVRIQKETEKRKEDARFLNDTAGSHYYQGVPEANLYIVVFYPKLDAAYVLRPLELTCGGISLMKNQIVNDTFGRTGIVIFISRDRVIDVPELERNYREKLRKIEKDLQESMSKISVKKQNGDPADEDPDELRGVPVFRMNNGNDQPPEENMNGRNDPPEQNMNGRNGRRLLNPRGPGGDTTSEDEGIQIMSTSPSIDSPTDSSTEEVINIFNRDVDIVNQVNRMHHIRLNQAQRNDNQENNNALNQPLNINRPQVYQPEEARNIVDPIDLIPPNELNNPIEQIDPIDPIDLNDRPRRLGQRRSAIDTPDFDRQSSDSDAIVVEPQACGSGQHVFFQNLNLQSSGGSSKAVVVADAVVLESSTSPEASSDSNALAIEISTPEDNCEEMARAAACHKGVQALLEAAQVLQSPETLQENEASSGSNSGSSGTKAKSSCMHGCTRFRCTHLFQALQGPYVEPDNPSSQLNTQSDSDDHEVEEIMKNVRANGNNLPEAPRSNDGSAISVERGRHSSVHFADDEASTDVETFNYKKSDAQENENESQPTTKSQYVPPIRVPARRATSPLLSPRKRAQQPNPVAGPSDENEQPSPKKKQKNKIESSETEAEREDTTPTPPTTSSVSEEEDVEHSGIIIVNSTTIMFGSHRTAIARSKFEKIDWADDVEAVRRLLRGVFSHGEVEKCKEALQNIQLTEGSDSNKFENLTFDAKRIADIIEAITFKSKIKPVRVKEIIITICEEPLSDDTSESDVEIEDENNDGRDDGNPAAKPIGNPDGNPDESSKQN